MAASPPTKLTAYADWRRWILALRSLAVSGPAVLDAIETHPPRNLFTPDLFKERAFKDPGPADRLRPDHQPA